jgi:hypothetical protein
MVKERCWSCKKVRSDVQLCATDDRLCRSCCRKNEEELELATSHRPNASKGGTPTMVTRSGLVGAAVRSTELPVRRGNIAAGVSPSIGCDITNRTVRRASATATGVVPSTGSLATKSVPTAPGGDADATVDNPRTVVGCSTTSANNSRGTVAVKAPSIGRLKTDRSQSESFIVDENFDEMNDYRQKIDILKGQVDLLIATVAKQSVSISKLSSQMNYILSFLDIQENDGSSHQADIGESIERPVADSLVQFQLSAAANPTSGSDGISAYQ